MKKTLKEVVEEEKIYIKEHPYKSSLSFLKYVLLYSSIVIAILFLLTRPLECKADEYSYKVESFQKIIDLTEERYDSNRLIEVYKPKVDCDYDFRRLLEPRSYNPISLLKKEPFKRGE